MGFLDSLFGRKKEPEVDLSQIEEKCPHAALRPHWDQPGDFGKNELISSYVCEGCGEKFTREQGAAVSAAVGESVRGTVEIDETTRKTVEEQAADQAAEFKHFPEGGDDESRPR
jgi:hypothetical protein